MLDEALDAPDETVLNVALDTLKQLNILSDDQQLTSLGETIIHIALDPRLSVFLVLATMLGVLNPALDIAAALSAPRPLFLGMAEDRKSIKDVKEKYSRGRRSDHIAYHDLIHDFERLRDYEQWDYCNDNRLHFTCMKNVLELKQMYKRSLEESELIVGDDVDAYNRNRDDIVLVESALLAAFYPNIVVRKVGEIRGTQIISDRMKQIDLKSQHAVRLNADSIAKESIRKGDRLHKYWYD